MLTIRAARPDDAPAIAAIRAQTWRAAYDGVIPADILAAATSPQSVATNSEDIRRARWAGMLLAEFTGGLAESTGLAEVSGGLAESTGLAVGSGAGEAAVPDAPGRPSAVGFASFGTERGAGGQPGSVPRPGQGQARAELYAIYVMPRQWSTGAGRALMDAVLKQAAVGGYACISLWVLQDNPRARRFYERAGFRETGDSQSLDDLGGVVEVRYERSLR